MDEYLTVAVHNEFMKRMEEEHRRQNHRISENAEAIKNIGALTIAVEKMANNMELMIQEQKDQGQRLKILEARDGEKWRKLVWYVFTAIIGGLIGYMLKQAGM